MEKHTSIANATGISDEVSHNSDGIQRNLSGRQIQMIAIEGSIGTALFVSIGSDLISGGPGSLLIAFTICSCILGCINSSMAEMAIVMPIPGVLHTLRTCLG